MMCKQYILDNSHSNPREESNRDKSANEQEKLWRCHDKLFANQTPWVDLDSSAPVNALYSTNSGLNTSFNGHAQNVGAQLLFTFQQAVNQQLQQQQSSQGFSSVL